MLASSDPATNNTLTTANSFDYNISEKDQLRGRLAWSSQMPLTRQRSCRRSGRRSAALLGGDPERISQLRPNVNNEFRFGFNRFSQVFPVGTSASPDWRRIPEPAGESS